MIAAAPVYHGFKVEHPHPVEGEVPPNLQGLRQSWP